MLCTRVLPQTSFLSCPNPLLSGVAVSFFLLFAMLTAQMFWVCELTYTGWKEIPGSICLVPRVVPISLVVSKLPPFPCTSGCLFIDLILSDDRFGCRLDRRSLDGTTNSQKPLSYCLSLTDLDR